MMPAKETAARVRMLTRQVTSLREDLCREAKRSAWAVERVKEKEKLISSLEKRVEEAAVINSRLIHEVRVAEELQKTTTDLKDTEIQKLTQTLKQREEETTSWRDSMNDQLMLAARETFRLENALSKRASSNSALGNACTRKLEKALARVGQRLMTIRDNVQRKPHDMSVFTTGNPDKEVASDKLKLEEKESNIRKILTTYRSSMSKLRDQILKSEKDNQALIQRIQELENETASLSKKVEEVESAKLLTARVHEAERENFKSTVDTLRETCDARLRRIGEVENELAQIGIDREELQAGMIRRQQKIEELEIFISRQKQEISEGLKLLHSSKTLQTYTDGRCRNLPDTHYSAQRDQNGNRYSHIETWSKQAKDMMPQESQPVARKQLRTTKNCVGDFDFIDREIEDMEANIQRVIAS